MGSAVKRSRVVHAVPFFYGWVVLFAGTVGIIMTGPGQTFGISVFVNYFIQDLGITRSTLSLIYGLATLTASLALPAMGRQIDRHGPRVMVVVIGLCFGLVAMGMSLVQSVFTLFLGFVGLRFLGQGSLQLVSNNVIAQWFVRKRGLVMGLSGLGMAAAFTIFPDIIHRFILAFGWRTAWVVLGLLIWAVVIPTGWFFFRDRPEDYGLWPDGQPVEGTEKGETPLEEHWTLPEARRTAAFWVFAAGLATIAMILTGLHFHQVSLFQSRGLSTSAAIGAFQVVGVASATSVFVVGWLLDHVSPRWLLAVAMSFLAGTMLLAMSMTRLWHVVMYGVLMGATSGFFRAIDSVVWAKYYGRRHLGAVRGAALMGVVIGTALGPYPLGLSRDVLGSYSPALTALLVLPLSIAVAALLVSRPRKRALAD